MAILKVARMGHPVLRARARPIERIELANPAVQKLIDDMIETMHEYRGAGLAAPQVHEGIRVFVALLEDDLAANRGPAGAAVPLINPEVTPVGDGVVVNWEGCLSIPEVRGRVPRAREIKVRALDRHGQLLDFRIRGFSARVIQHETDHLDGILFLDRMESFETLTYLEEFSKFWASEREE